jgi:hypothetical protein
MHRWAAWHNALITHQDMASEMLIDSALAHGTAMIRTFWLERVGGWTDQPWAEDLDLWLRLLDAGARLGKRPEFLYGWRQRPGSATRRDPRYRRDRFLALKLGALERGFLRGARSLTLVGVGESLVRWRDALARSHRVRVVESKGPGPQVGLGLYPPVVLVFGAAAARQRWRRALGSSRMTENKSFIFVA